MKMFVMVCLRSGWIFVSLVVLIVMHHLYHFNEQLVYHKKEAQEGSFSPWHF
jgi:hypothetical protein